MTKELILSGNGVFPLAGAMKMGEDIPMPPSEVSDAVKKGIQLGTKLGRKLQIRAEVHPHKIVRKKSGKINKRQLHEAAFDAEDLFYKVRIHEHSKATLHITVDASSSMTGNKWYKTMTAVVAVCKAASMIDNVHVTVSFRTTQVSNHIALPYVIMAYNSHEDKFSKVKTLFPYLCPAGCTPEGLAFGAIMNLFEGITPDEEDRYFLNLSDGMPYYHLQIPSSGLFISYQDTVATTHTKAQVDKIRRHGVEVLSYFIEDSHSPFSRTLAIGREEKANEKFRKEQFENTPQRRDFRKMYGKNAKFIDVESIVDLAKTINGLFLSHSNEKTT
jgi:hypothetical protein